MLRSVTSLILCSLVSASVFACAGSEGPVQIVFDSFHDGDWEIFVMDVDGTNVRQLTTNDDGDYNPDWSPDGKEIVFYSNRDGDAEVFVMDADGTNVRQLTTNDDGDLSPDWSPDGKEIAFNSDRYGDYEIFVMDADGTNVRQLTQKGFSPDYKP